MKILLVDGNNSAHRCFTDRGLCARYQDPQVLAIVLLRIIYSVVRDNRINRVMCAWDDGLSPLRTAIHPGYKAGRAAKHEEPSSKHKVITERTPWMRNLFTNLGIIDISGEHAEADDMIYRAHACAMDRGWGVDIMSNDSDLRSMVNQKTTIHLGKGTAPLTEASFYEKWGFAPWLFPVYKAMVGDRSDDIPGAKGIGSVTAKSVMLMVEREHPSTMMEALAVLRAVCSANRRAKKLLTPEVWNQFKLALRLIDLAAEPFPDRVAMGRWMEEVAFNPWTDRDTAHEMLVADGLSELAFDIPMYVRELVRLPHAQA